MYAIFMQTTENDPKKIFFKLHTSVFVCAGFEHETSGFSGAILDIHSETTLILRELRREHLQNYTFSFTL